MTQNQNECSRDRPTAFTIVFVAPILPGRSEAWRRFIQELSASRRAEYEESRRRLGIYAERAWISETLRGSLAAVAIESERPDQVLAQLAASRRPFDGWFKQQMLKLTGIDLNQPSAGLIGELIFEWQS